jgi:hypothetical protein
MRFDLTNTATPTKSAIYIQSLSAGDTGGRTNSGIMIEHFSEKDNGHEVSGICSVETGNGNAGTFNKWVQSRPAGTPTPIDATSRQYGYCLEVYAQGDSTAIATTGADSGIGVCAAVGSAVGPPWAEGFRAIPRANADNLDKRIAFIATQNQDDLQQANNANFKVYLNGGTLLGTGASEPTGGNKGPGTLNLATDIYKNGTAMTQPDYVFEKWATGNIARFAHNEGAAEYQGLRSLTDTKDFVRQHYTLPSIHAWRESSRSSGLFSGSDAVLAALEEAYLHIFALHERIEQLEHARG